MNQDAPQAASCCSTGAANPAAAVSGNENLLAPQSEDMTTCPVMAGTPVSKASAEAAGLFRDHEGQRYHFCCPGCGPAFDADPARYAAGVA